MCERGRVNYHLRFRRSPSDGSKLEGASIQPDRLLLCDSFTQLIVCRGAALAGWLREGERHPAAEELAALVGSVDAEVARLDSGRFPAPERILCDQHGSKARYLTQKLHQDVPLPKFLQGLYSAIVE